MVDEFVLSVPAPVNVIPRFVLNIISAVVFKVPPLNVILAAVADPGVAPRLLSALMLNVPAEIVVIPV